MSRSFKEWDDPTKHSSITPDRCEFITMFERPTIAQQAEAKVHLANWLRDEIFENEIEPLLNNALLQEPSPLATTI